MASRWVTRPSLVSACSSCRHRLIRQQTRLASDDSSNSENKSLSSDADSPSEPNPPTTQSVADHVFGVRIPPERRRPSRSAQDIFGKPSSPSPSQAPKSPASSSSPFAAYDSPDADALSTEPYHLHVYAHKHNMHITFSEPGRNPILSFSCGNIGLKKAARGTFDAGYQLATYTMRKMAMHQWRVGGKKMTRTPMRTIRDVGTKDSGVGIELIMRGFGPGREAFQKALLGTEGQMIKPLIARVTDATRLKFGGTRSPAVRRLG